MFRASLFISAAVCVCLLAGLASAQNYTDQKTRQLVSALDKTKYKKKEKANISIELYVDVKNEPAVRANKTEYSGIYSDDGYQLLLTVNSDGSASGSGFDTLGAEARQLNFTLRDARVDGALITAIKAYENGESTPFEGVFVNRTSREGTNPNAVRSTATKFGLGFIQHGHPIEDCDPEKVTKTSEKSLAEMANKNEMWTNRVFLEKR